MGIVLSMGIGASGDDPDIPNWSRRGSNKWENYGFLEHLYRSGRFPFGGRIFLTKEDVVRYFEKKGVRITGVSVDPDPGKHLDQYYYKRLLQRYAKTARLCNPASGVCNDERHRWNKEYCNEWQNKYNKEIVKNCGFIIDGVEASESERRHG